MELVDLPQETCPLITQMAATQVMEAASMEVTPTMEETKRMFSLSLLTSTSKTRAKGKCKEAMVQASASSRIFRTFMTSSL